jgi:hypothetical protein
VAGSGLAAGLGPRTPACGRSQRQARSQPGPGHGGLFTLSVRRPVAVATLCFLGGIAARFDGIPFPSDGSASYEHGRTFFLDGGTSHRHGTTVPFDTSTSPFDGLASQLRPSTASFDGTASYLDKRRTPFYGSRSPLGGRISSLDGIASRVDPNSPHPDRLTVTLDRRASREFSANSHRSHRASHLFHEHDDFPSSRTKAGDQRRDVAGLPGGSGGQACWTSVMLALAFPSPVSGYM